MAFIKSDTWQCPLRYLSEDDNSISKALVVGMLAFVFGLVLVLPMKALPLILTKNFTETIIRYWKSDSFLPIPEAFL